jgi:hypothetical protein
LYIKTTLPLLCRAERYELCRGTTPRISAPAQADFVKKEIEVASESLGYLFYLFIMPRYNHKENYDYQYKSNRYDIVTGLFNTLVITPIRFIFRHSTKAIKQLLNIK